MVGQYDALCENGTLNNILSLFADDYSAMCSVLDSVLDELLVQNSIDAQVVKIANKIMTMLNAVGDGLNNLDLSSILPEGVDMIELISKINALK
jgi:hypothetical protein